MRARKALERFQEQTERVCRFEFANAQQEDYVLSTCRETLADGGVGSSKTFERICPPGWIKRDVLSEMTLFNGAEIVWAHLDENDIKTLMGLEINGAFLDQVEEIHPEM